MAHLSAGTVATILAVMAATMAAAPRGAEGVITCPQVYGALNLCITYLRVGGVPPPACCGAARSLLAAEHTVQDRRKACVCLKTAAAGVSGLKIANAVALPAKCGISYPYRINPNIDCSRVN